jgi:hypothetical protein
MINYIFITIRNNYQVSFVIAGVDELEPEDVYLVVGQACNDGFDEGDLLRQKVVEDVDAVLEVHILCLRRLLGF